MTNFKRRFDFVQLLTWTGTIALAIMLFWTMADIGMRLVFNRPLHGTLDLVEATLVLVAFLALPECFRHDEQIKVDVFDHAVGPWGLASLRLGAEVTTLVFLILLGATVYQPLADAYRFGDQKPDLPIPIAGLLAAIEVALVTSAIVVARRVVRLARAFAAAGAHKTGDHTTGSVS